MEAAHSHLVDADELPSRPLTSQGAPISSKLKPLTLRPSHSNPALSPSKLAPALRLQRTSETASDTASELWAPTVDADGAYIRRTYAYFEQQGVAGDGWHEGREWTRERGASSPWEEQATSQRKLNASRKTLHASRSSLRQVAATANDDDEAQAGVESLRVPPLTPLMPRPTSSLSIMSVNQSEESLLSAPASHTPASLRTPTAASMLAAPREDSIDEEVRLAKESLLGSIDRYGFFSRSSSSTSDRCPRTTVLPAEPLGKLPSKSSLSGATSSTAKRGSRNTGRESSSRAPSRSASSQASPTLSDMGSSSSPTSAVLEAAHAKRASSEAAQRQREAARTEKWQRMLRVEERDAGQNVRAYALAAAVASGSGAGARKLRRRIYKGVPDRWRAAAWWALVQLPSSSRAKGDEAKAARARLEEAEQRYAELIKAAGPHDVQIDLDVPRTISGHVLFHTRYGQGQRSLFHVLHAFSLHCSTQCAYCQGMGPIAATLLVYMPPGRAYAVLVALHDEARYKLHKTFSPGFPGLVESFYVQEQLTRLVMPDVAAAFEAQGISTSSYATKWYITLFAHVVPFATQVRLWDALLLEGADALVAMSLAILWSLRSRLTRRNAGFEVILGALSAEFLPEDDDVLLRWIGQLLARDDVRRAMREARKRWAQLEESGEAMNHIT